MPELMHVVEDDDVDGMVWARDHGRIFLANDTFIRGSNSKGPTKILMGIELYEHGGWVITVTDDGSRGPHRIVGKILFHYHLWTEHFRGGSGKYWIGDLRTAGWQSPHSLVARIKAHQIPQGKEYLDLRDAARKGPPNPKLARPRTRRKEAPTRRMDLHG